MISIRSLIWCFWLIICASCSGGFFTGAGLYEKSSAVDDVDEASKPETTSAEDLASEGRTDDTTLKQAEGSGPKPSDGSEDWGYVQPEIEDDGDLFFRTKGLHPQVEMEGHFLSGTFPVGMKIKVRLDSQYEVGEFPPLHPPVLLQMENSIGGVLEASDFGANFRVALLPSSGLGSADLVLAPKGQLPNPVPTSGGNFEVFTSTNPLAMWMSAKASQFNPIVDSTIEYNSVSQQYIFLGLNDGEYESYFIAFYPLTAIDLTPTCFDSRRVGYATIKAADMPGGRRGILRVVSEAEGEKSLAVICVGNENLVSSLTSKVIVVEQR